MGKRSLGVLKIIDESIEESFRYRAEQGRSFSYADRIDNDYPTIGIALIGVRRYGASFLESSIGFLGTIRRHQAVTTVDRRLILDNLREFEPLTIGELQSELPKNAHRYLREGSLPPSGWAGVEEALDRLRPETVAVRRQLYALLNRPRDLSGAERIHEFEQDAINMALEFAGLKRDMLAEQFQPSQLPDGVLAPFISNLESTYMREDTMIVNDLMVFGDWRRLGALPTGTVTFERHGRVLTVANLNRQPLEETLGVDLLYYSHEFDSFVLVQYKAFSLDNRKWVYRPSADASLKVELDRMARIPQSRWEGNVSGYRFHDGCCFLKFCTRKNANPRLQDMIPGFYVPVDYWHALVRSETFSGPRGGQAVTPDNLGRHLSNTEFAALVAGGWIGSRGPTSALRSEIVRAGLETGKSVVLAESSAPQQVVVDDSWDE